MTGRLIDMKTKYFYGVEDCEYYSATDLDAAYEEIRDYDFDGYFPLGVIIIEMVKSRGGERWCNEEQTFTESGYCGQFECGEKYKPRNGKNGICKHLTYGLMATGRKWIITGEYEYKKISSRRK